MMQAVSRGVSDLLIGIVLAITPLTVAALSPLFGYFVSACMIKPAVGVRKVNDSRTAPTPSFSFLI